MGGMLSLAASAAKILFHLFTASFSYMVAIVFYTNHERLAHWQIPDKTQIMLERRRSRY